MTYTLTSDQLSDLQADLGITSDQSVFTDSELNRLFTRAVGDYELTITYAVRQLLMQAARFNDYTVGQTSESKSQVYKQLKDTLTYYETKQQGKQQVKIVGMRPVPTRGKDIPATDTSERIWLRRRY